MDIAAAQTILFYRNGESFTRDVTDAEQPAVVERIIAGRTSVPWRAFVSPNEPHRALDRVEFYREGRLVKTIRVYGPDQRA